MKVGIIQQKYLGSKEATIAKTCEYIKQLKAQGAELICLGELHQSEYFCQSENVNFFDLAENFEADKAFWSEVARQNGVVLLSSLFEKRTHGLYHNSVFVFEKDGSLAGKYRKMHIPDDPNFYEKFYFTPGDLGFEPIQTSVGKLGVLICWDQWYPEAARIMALKGADVLIYPTAIAWFEDDDEKLKQDQLNAWINIQKAHAIANGLNVISVNRVGFEKDSSGTSKGLLFWGNSFVAGALGEELFRANSKDECAKVVEISIKQSEEVRKWWPFLRDRRIEFFGDLNRRFID